MQTEPLNFRPASLAQNAEAVPAGGEAQAINAPRQIMELKLDGIRLLAHIGEGGRVRTYTRSGKEQTGKLPQVEAELAAHFPPDSWVDGEVVAIRIREDGSVEHHWGTAQSVMGANVDKAARRSGDVTYSIFDVLAVGGTDARSLNFEGRRRILELAFANGDGWDACTLVPQMEPSEEAYAAILAAGFEGAMLKSLDARYCSGQRGKGQRKLKGTHTEDVIITALPLDGEGKYAGQVGAVVFSQIRDGALVEMGRCSGMSDAERLDLSRNAASWLGRVIEVRHNGVMPTGGWRHPVWMRTRDDKLAEECIAS